ncbi:hypothetical protein OFM93_30670, partial [Escherichia coli]|nr:hypothetical protein [Escherichia coli]
SPEKASNFFTIFFQNNITTILDLKHRRYFSQRRQIVKSVASFRSRGGVNLFGHYVVKFDCREFDGVDNGLRHKPVIKQTDFQAE